MSPISTNFSKESSEVSREIERLRSEIRHHAHLYYVLDSPEITDSEYDRLYRHLEDLERQYPHFISPDSPTQRVGGQPVDKFDQVPHALPMLSLSNIFSEQELMDFDARTRKALGSSEELCYVVEPKLDGIAIELVYENGALVTGATRGDGLTGEDVTSNIKTIKTVPLRLAEHGLIPPLAEIRGEIFMNRSDFDSLNQERDELGLPSFANPRNATAGSVRQLDPRVTAGRALKFLAHSIGRLDGDLPESHWDLLVYLGGMGIPVNTQHSKRCKGIQEILDHYRFLQNIRASLPYEIDGAVVKLDSLASQKLIGFTTKSPRWAVAFKFKPLQAITRIVKIDVGVGRTGNLTPVAIMEPVQVGGVTVSRATLHNQDEINRKDIREGDTVIIQRAGDVIPEIVKVVAELRPSGSRPYQIPDKCPVCQSIAVRTEGQAAKRCVNTSCPARLKESLRHFASRSAMDIEGLGDKLISLLVDEGLIAGPADLYALRLSDLVKLPRMAEKSASKLIDAIDKSRNVSAGRFLYGLGIPLVGEFVARTLVEELGSFQRVIDADREEMEQIFGIGPEVAKSVSTYFQEPRNRNMIDALLKAGVQPRHRGTDDSSGESTLAGKTFVFTGRLHMPRSQAKALVEALGGKVGAGVSRRTDYVVVGEDPGSKREEAIQLGIGVISEDEFLDLTK